jgi:hypothetical protein
VPEPRHDKHGVGTLISSTQYHLNDSGAMVDALPKRMVKVAGPSPSSAAVAAALSSGSSSQASHAGEHRWKPTRRIISMVSANPPHAGVRPAHILARQGIAAAAPRGFDPVTHDDTAPLQNLRPSKRSIQIIPGEGADRGIYDPLAAMPKKGVVRDASGYNMRFRASVEGSLETSLQRKRHIDATDLQVTRNGIGLAKPGDLQYSAIEYKPGFYKTEGGLAGASSG